ncbi:putative Polysaccharide biosynthesis protein [Modestobacter italicus]|uniref:Polysaccharide biosynthesis protein n=1 Tax=Modestobacter italicus (strain DSM 44449 / CECT 9708 / BC 501) TaxID=2732864 RepID=I4EXJ6_MODI5|nr:polysaccharide biosynthesis protein [Modestobacter marinus]CCH88109.1 putative Polysaccharide biosynthesis protein [Modestobacter marinus]
MSLPGPPRAAHRPALASLHVPLWSIVQAGVQMGVALLSARWLGPGDRGTLVLATTVASLLLLVSSVGTGAASRVVLAEPGRWWTWSRYLRLAAVLTVPHLVLAATVGVYLVTVLSGAGAGVRVAFVVYAVAALGAHLVREGLHGLGRHRTSIVLDVVAAAAQLALVAAAHAAAVYSATTALVIAAACYTGALLTGAVIGWRADAHSRTVAPAVVTTREWWHRVGESLAFSRFALVAALGQYYVVSGDRLVLGALGRSDQVGIYSVASTLASLAVMAALALTAPITRKTAERGSLQAWERAHVPVLALTGAAAVGVAVGGWFAIPLLLGPEFDQARTLLPVFCAAAVPYASCSIDAAASAGLRDLRTGAVAAVVGSVVMTALATAGYAAWGTHGVAIAVLVTYLVMACIARVRLRRAATALAAR